MNMSTSHRHDRRGRIGRFLCHPLVILAIVEFVILAFTTYAKLAGE